MPGSSELDPEQVADFVRWDESHRSKGPAVVARHQADVEPLTILGCRVTGVATDDDDRDDALRTLGFNPTATTT